MKLTMDFEARSAQVLKATAKKPAVSSWRYACDETTSVICLAVKLDDQKPRIFIPEWVAHILCREYPNWRDMIGADSLIETEELLYLIHQVDIIEAHHSEFERAMWHHQLHKKLGWPDLPFEKVRCSAAKAAACALPRALGGLCEALGLSVKKDMVGNQLVKKICKPRPPSAAEKEANPDWRDTLYWHEDPDEFIRVIIYCMQDVNAEYAASEALPDLSPDELQIWQLDQRINQRGVPVDRESIEVILSVIARYKETKISEFNEVTGGAVAKPTQTKALQEWVASRTGYNVTSVDKPSVKALLKRDLPTDVRQALELKSALNLSSTAKFKAALASVQDDGFVRGMFMYHGAATGRWTGKIMQMHNLPRKTYEGKDFDDVLHLMSIYDVGLLSLLYNDPLVAASKCIRGIIKAPPGKVFYSADYRAIEGRALAYLAGEQWVLDAHRASDRGEGPEMYCIAASVALNKPVELITPSERQSPGKVSELACGYQGSVGACIAFGATGSDKEIYCNIVKPWRKARPNITAFWKAVGDCALDAVRRPGHVYMYRDLKFAVRDRFLMIRLPSGRLLRYFDPEIEMLSSTWTDPETGETSTFTRPAVTFMGMKQVDGKTVNQWTRVTTYGGKLTENIVQAFSRDVLRDGIIRVEKHGYPVVMHVHDEATSLCAQDFGDLEEFEGLLSEVPSWAKGLPLKAKGWKGIRYRK